LPKNLNTDLTTEVITASTHGDQAVTLAVSQILAGSLRLVEGP
jgi:hypothetical protein